MGDLISIIVPVYNAEKYLQRCLESILCQTYLNLEVLLINDGSTDGSADICKYYKQKDNRVKVIHKENGGVSSARNTGLDIACGDWIGFVDADDWIEADMFEKLCSHAHSDNADIIICGHIDYRTDGTPQVKSFPNLEITNRDSALFYLISDNYFEGYVWNKLTRQQVINDKRIRFLGEINFCEDVIFNCHTFLFAKKIVYIPDAFYHHCLNEGSAMQAFNEKRLTELNAWNFIINMMEHISASLENTAKIRYAHAAVCMYYQHSIKPSNAISKQYLKNESLRYFPRYILSRNVSFYIKIKFILRLFFPRFTGYIWQKIKKYRRNT